jgi:DNA-directed RNA polymerase subunit RPC12/RpoP
MKKNEKRDKTVEELLKDAIIALEKGENEEVKKLILQVKAIQKNKSIKIEKIEPKIMEVKKFQIYRLIACTHCGREMPLEALYCDNCGFRLR